MRPSIPTLGAFLPLILAGCSSLSSHPSLGVWFVDEELLVVRSIDEPDTVATLAWGDSVEVIDVPAEARASDDHFVVRVGEELGHAERDALIEDLLFRSKYSHGRPINVAADGRRYFVDEFGDTVTVRRRPNLVRKYEEDDAGVGVDVVEEKRLSRRRSTRRR